MFPGGRHLQNPPTGPPQPVPFPSQFYYGAPPAVSNPGSNNRTEDPIMKKAILDKCEGKIVQLYRHRISGQGIFFPMEQPKSKKINGSSLLAFHHPRLEFNMLPIPPIWMCPEVSLEVKEEEKVNKEVKKPETISKVDSQAKRSKSPAALMMQSVNVEGDSLTFDAKVPPPIFKPATPSPPGIGVPPAPVPAPTISEPPTPVPAPTMTVPDPYATTAIDIWAEMEKERRRKEKEKQWEVLMTVEKRKKKKKRRSRSRSSSEGNLKEKSRTRRSRSRSRRSHSRRSRSRRSHRRSRSRSRKRHRSHSKRRRRRRSSSLSLSPPRHRPISPHEMRYGETIRRSQSPLGRPVSPTRVHGMVGEWPPTENVWPQMGNPPNFHAPPPPYYGYPNADPYAPVMRPQFPMGPFTPQIQPPPGPVGPYGAPPFVDGPREFIPMTPQPQFGVGTKGNEKIPVERFVQEVIIIDDDVPVEQPANPAPSESTYEEVLMPPGVGEDSIEIYPPGEQPPVNKPKFLGVESEYTKPLRVKFRKLLAPIHKILDYIRHYQREVPNSHNVVKNLEAGNCEFEGLYTLVDGILCKLAVERGKSEFFKVVLPEVRRYRIIKELHKVHHEYSIHQLQEIIADVFPQEERQILNKFLVSVFRDCRECDALDVQRRAHKSGHLEGHDGNEKTRKTSKGGKRGSSEKDDKRGFSKDEIKNGEEELRAGVVGSKEERGSRKKGEERGSEEERMRQDGRHHSSDSRGKRERNADVQKKADDGSRDKLKARQTLRRREEPQKGKNSDKAETDLRGKEEKKGKSICVENVERMAENDYSENDKTPKVDLASKVSGQPSQNNKKADPPKANPEDFKCRVRRVQLNVPEFKNHIEALEGAEKKTTDSALILKAGMLCRRFPSTSGDGKAEVKIVVDVTSLKEMVAIVHTMASVHAPLQKTMTVFTKHFVPIDGLELAVKKVLDECSKCKKP